MPKPDLIKVDEKLERELIETLLAGLKEWRPDLDYPESHSDMQACVRGIMRMYDVKRLPLPKPLKLECHVCDGARYLIQNEHHRERCPECGGKGYKESFR